MSLLEVEIREDGAAATVALSGELDVSEAGRLQQELLALEARNPQTIVLDLSGLKFLDSSGLRLVIEADHRAREAGRRLALVPGPGPVHRVFQVALLEARLEFLDPEPEGDPGDGEATAARDSG